MKSDAIFHPKTKRLEKILGVPLYQAAGLLECLFQFATQFADDGRVGKYSADEIADFLEYEGEADHLVASLKLAGWLDGDGPDLSIHDWFDHCPEFVKKRIQRRGNQWRPPAADGVLPREGEANQEKENHNSNFLNSRAADLIDKIGTVKGIAKPYKTPNNLQLAENILDQYGEDLIDTALARFPLDQTLLDERTGRHSFRVNLAWFAGKVDQVLEGIYSRTKTATRKPSESEALETEIFLLYQDKKAAEDLGERERIAARIEELERRRPDPSELGPLETQEQTR